MSVGYTTEPKLRYDGVLAALPDALGIVREDPGGRVLLRDACGNTMWLLPDSDGTACFEQFGRQGDERHFRDVLQFSFGVIFEDEYGGYYDIGTCRVCGASDEVSESNEEAKRWERPQ